MRAVVFGNATLDVICCTVDDVPRYESIAFEHVIVAPGGCGSNVAIGLKACGVDTAIVARIGEDDAADLVMRYWRRMGIDLRYVRSVPDHPTGTSIGLVDSDAQPRFIHTSGANARLTVDALDLPGIISSGAQALHIGGFFVLPGLMDGQLPGALAQARQAGLLVTLDVVRSPRMKDASLLWPCMPHLDVFLCNAPEAYKLTGEEQPAQAARALLSHGSQAVIVKLGGQGCWLESIDHSEIIPGVPVEVVDTTGAGDAFAAGLIAALLDGKDLLNACLAANTAGAKMVRSIGAISGWAT